MRTHYMYELYFENDKVNWQELIRTALANPGFIPRVMSVYQNNGRLEGVEYNEGILRAIPIEENAPDVTIRQHFYDEQQDNPWFKLSSLDGKFISLKWSNVSFDFLRSDDLVTLLQRAGFAAGYAFNNEDAWDQTGKAKDVSGSTFALYPGQFRYTCGMQFMAAPLMWFGPSFFEIISQEKLFRFGENYPGGIIANDIVGIKLFDLYTDPSEEKNRENQRQFWSFFQLEEVISQYEEKNSVDAVQSLNNFLAKKLKKGLR